MSLMALAAILFEPGSWAEYIRRMVPLIDKNNLYENHATAFERLLQKVGKCPRHDFLAVTRTNLFNLCIYLLILICPSNENANLIRFERYFEYKGKKNMLVRVVGVN